MGLLQICECTVPLKKRSILMMSFFRVISKTVALLSLGVAVTVTAQDTSHFVKCPTLDKIHQAASLIDKVQCMDNLCDAFTDHSVFYHDSLYWMIGLLRYETSSSSDEAIREAQNIAANVSVMLSDVIVRVFNTNLCFYVVTSDYDPDDEDIKLVVAAGFPDKKASISLSSALLRKII